MTTIDHLSREVADVLAARVFYSRILDILGIRCLAEGERFAACGRDRIAFLLLTLFDGKAAKASNGVDMSVAAPDRDLVTKAHAARLDGGASDEGAPGVRAAHPMPGVFAAYLRDPWGNKIELVHDGFSA